ncbi:MAG TPA: diguanylate cyclase, partial [Ardenticatenaceae bacterium]|nr:diguanylate cyclase [Ardenticatenaceae bacterium]
TSLYRAQVGTVLLGVIVPWAVNAMSLVGLNPFPNLDPTPFAFTLTGLFLAYSLLRYRLLDIVPVARGTLIEHMSDGVLVLDARGRLVDINPAAEPMIARDGRSPIGQPVESLLSAWPDLLARSREGREGHSEIVLDEEGRYHLDVRIVPLHDRRGRLTGQLLVLRDVTETRQGHLELQRAHEQLQAQLAEIEALQARLREQAIRDPLTGLFNRRYLEETLERELAKAARGTQPVSLAMMDIDFFKQLNDRFGHQAGDRVLQALAALLLADTRRGDVVSRYGGEEFVVVLPGASAAEARQRAEAWRAAFEALVVPHESHGLQATVSVGVATFPLHGTGAPQLLHAADTALYKAKAAGRNRVMAAEQTGDGAAEEPTYANHQTSDRSRNPG